MPIPSYIEVDYENLPSHNTPLSAQNLNKTDEQVAYLTALLQSVELALGGGDLASIVKNPELNYIDFVVSAIAAFKRGRLIYSDADDTLTISHSGNVMQQIGEETYARVTNNTGASFVDGDLIGLTGTGTTVGKYVANGSLPPIYVLGVCTQTIANGQRGRVTVYGRVRGLNTSAYVVGDTVYANPAIAGGLVKVKPTAPNLVIPVGVVTAVSATDGEIFVRPVLDQQLYYGSFAKTADVIPTAINTANAITFDATMTANGVHTGSTASRITVDHSGLYAFNASFQLTSTNSSIKNVFMWFRKNGVDIPNTTMVRSLESGTAVAVQNRSMFFSLAAGDYIELMWASDSTAVTLDARPSTAFCPTAPAVALTVDQIQQ